MSEDDSPPQGAAAIAIIGRFPASTWGNPKYYAERIHTDSAQPVDRLVALTGRCPGIGDPAGIRRRGQIERGAAGLPVEPEPVPELRQPCTAAACTASRIGMLETTSPAMRSASSTGTPLAARMLSVRVKRAVFRPRASRPMMGMRSSTR